MALTAGALRPWNWNSGRWCCVFIAVKLLYEFVCPDVIHTITHKPFVHFGTKHNSIALYRFIKYKTFLFIFGTSLNFIIFA